MSKLQILTALLLSYLLYSCAEETEAQKRIDDILKPPPIIIKTSRAPQTENSYFSRITNWLKSFAEPEKKTTIIRTNPQIISGPSGPPASFLGPPSYPPSSHQGSQNYLPPSHQVPQNYPTKNYGPPQTFSSPFINRPNNLPVLKSSPPSYVPAQQMNHGSNLIPISGPLPQAQDTSNSNKYLPPHQSGVKTKDCNPCNKEPWIPVASNYGSNTLIGFVPHSNIGNKGRPSGIYGPPQGNYRPPKEFGPPIVPPGNQYGPPNHIPPPSLHYGPPDDISIQKPTSNNYEPPNSGPSVNYGPPKPAFLPTPSSIIPNKYGPPSISRPSRLKQILPPPPSAFMGPPPSSTKYGQPSTDFGNAPSLDYDPPHSDFSGPPSGHNNVQPSSVINSYGPPPSGPANISPLKPSETYKPPPIDYGPSKELTNNYGPPPSGPAYNPPSKPLGQYGPPSGANNQYVPSSFPTPTASAISHNFDFPPSSLNSLPKINHHTSFVTPVSISNNKPAQNSYGPPAAGPIQNSGKVKITSEEYLPPPEELPLSSGHDNNYDSVKVPSISQPVSSYNKPIPFPNMSPSFILPIRNAHPFNNHPRPINLPPQGANTPIHTSNSANQEPNVQISQSIPVADFLSTIEYPPNVVQSPIIDLVVNDNIENSDGQHNNNGYQVNLKDNPIVVDSEEHHQEASDNHASVAIHNAIPAKITYTPNLLNSIEDSKPTASVPFIQQFNNLSNVQDESSLQTLLSDNNLATIIAKQLLTDNKNPPKPFQPSGNIGKKLVSQVNKNAQATNNAFFVQPTIDYSSWKPSVGGISTSIQPPLSSQNSWISKNNYVPYTTKKPKQIQIIVPYTTNNKENNWHQKGSKTISANYNPPISLFGKLPSAEESQWEKYVDHNFQESKTNIAQTVSPLSNIKDFFKDVTVNIDASHQNLPFDILKLQKNIDVWTEQEFNKMRFDAQSSTTSRFAYSKKIPEEYLTTQSISLNEVTTNSPRNSKLFHDYLASGSVHRSVETRPQNLTELDNIDNNLVDNNHSESIITSTQKSEVTPTSWDKIQVSISPLTNERVYVVTPLPWERDAPTPQSAWSYVPKKDIQHINKKLADNANFVFNSPRFSVRPEPVQMNKSKEEINSKIHLVYSDWPDLINNLATTTATPPTATSYPLATLHPLLGRMDISEHSPVPTRPEGTVQTYTGHSKVVTAVTATPASKKRTEVEDKKFTTTTKKPTSDKT